jgi:hypothetical protein
MTTRSQPASARPDPAAIFACALSLWKACNEYAATQKGFNLSECFNGIDQFMREAMRIAARFEDWACRHVNFDELDDVWPYLLEDKFGGACLARLFPDSPFQFDEKDCLWIALHLRLPVIVDDMLPVPIDLTAQNPVAGTGFRAFRIQTVRDSLDTGEVVPFVADDDPFDEEFAERYFALCGVGEDGDMEHIAERTSYGELLSLAQRLAPGIDFPAKPSFPASRSKRD